MIRRKSFFDTMFREFEDVLGEFSELGDFESISRFARTSFKAEKDHYTLKVEVPGLGPEDVEVELKGDDLVLTYSGKSNSLTVPKDVDKDRIAASVKNGILDISLPKMVPEKGGTRKIEIK